WGSVQGSKASRLRGEILDVESFALVSSNGSFPLTPTLSPGERENSVLAFDKSEHFVLSKSGLTSLPPPEGTAIELRWSRQNGLLSPTLSSKGGEGEDPEGEGW